MANQITQYSEELYDYRVNKSSPMSEAWRKLASATDGLSNSQMRTSADVALMLQTLSASIGSSSVIDVGTFTGCSALAMAEVLPRNGVVTTFDVSDQHLDLATEHWQLGGVADKIKFQLGDATSALESMAQSQESSVDFAFIDANKKAYLKVYESLMVLVRPGGYIVIDDTLWAGKIVDENCEDRQLPALREFNSFVAQDSRVIATVLPIGNGLTIAWKR